MLKSLGIMIGGIFVGAVGAEIIRRKYPDALDKLYAKTRDLGSETKEALAEATESLKEVKEAFVKGYKQASRAAQASA